MNQGLDLVGRQIGAYRVDSLIGAGGYSRVYLAIDDNVGRQAAIKVLLPSNPGAGYTETTIQRFEREARIVANLRDPNSVQMYEYGQTDEGMLYMIFEFIEGDTLEEVRRHQGALPALRVVKILEQVLLSLEEAHTMGLVHRDIKPANIMVYEHIGRKDQVKVLDFGVGKAVGGDAPGQNITQAGILVGTPLYMAPEQWSTEEEVTQQTDIYSLGLVVYELLTGKQAIEANGPVHIMKAHLDPEPLELPADLDIPSGLRRVVNTMLQKEREDRYTSVSEVLRDLSRLKPQGSRSDTLERDEQELKRQAGPPTAEVGQDAKVGAVSTQVQPEDRSSSGSSKKVALVAVVFMSLIVVGVGTYALLSSSSADASAEEVAEVDSEAQSAESAGLGDDPDEVDPDERDEPEGVADGEELAANQADAGRADAGDAGDAGELAELDEDQDQDRDDGARADEQADEEQSGSTSASTKKTGSGSSSSGSQGGGSSSGGNKSKSSSGSSGNSGGGLILYPADDE